MPIDMAETTFARYLDAIFEWDGCNYQPGGDDYINAEEVYDEYYSVNSWDYA